MGVRAAIVVLIMLITCGCSDSGQPTAPVATPTPSTVVTPATTSASPTPTPTPTPLRPATPSPSPSPTPSPGESTPAAPGPMIVIDPGHSGSYRRSTDPATGLRDIDYPNYPEIYEMFDVSVCVARGLRLDGYRVRLTKKRALGTVGLAARAEIANDAKAELAISVHNDHGQGPDFQGTYDQRGRPDASGRYHAMYRGSGSARTVFDRPAVARKSQRYAKIIAAARTRTQERKVAVRENSFTGRAPLEPGNLSIVQLLATVPWVYNEVGAKTGGSVTAPMTIEAELGYARGLLIGVEQSIPLAGGEVDQPSAGVAKLRGCLIESARDRPNRYRPKTS